jgi:hypothetical protein
MGYLPQQQVFLQDSAHLAYLDTSGCLEQTIGLDFTAYDHIRLWTTLETYDTPSSDEPGFNPFRSDYSVGLEFTSKNFVAGIKHNCDHPVIWNWGNQKLGYGEQATELYVTVKGSTRF